MRARWQVWTHDDRRVTVELDEAATPPGIALELHVYADGRGPSWGCWLLEAGRPLLIVRGARA